MASHEFGHFLLAKLNGNTVVEFSIGLGPTIWGIKKGETIAQVMFQKYLVIDNDNAEGNRTGGFGSTDK